MKTKNLAIGVDLGASYIRAGIVDTTGKITNFAKVRSSTPQNLLKFLNSILQQKKARAEFGCIGIGAPGPLDLTKGMILETPNLVAFRNTPIVKLLKQEFKLPVFLERDTNVALIGEAAKGAASNVKNAVMLSLGTGVGGAILINSRLYHGEHGIGAELGHLLIDIAGPACSCGEKGHLEAYLGLAGVLRDYGMDHWKLIDEVQMGEKEAFKIAEKLGEILGVALVNIVNIFDPKIIILSGGLTKLGEKFVNPARKILEEKAFVKPVKAKVVSGQLGDFAGVLGAAKLVFSH